MYSQSIQQIHAEFFQKVTHQFNHNVIREYMLIYFLKSNQPRQPVATFWTEPLSSFTISCNMHSPWGLSTHWEFFQKVLQNAITMYPVIYSIISLRVYVKIGPYWESIVITLKRAWWGHCDAFWRTFWKKLSMSGSASCVRCMLHEMVKELRGSVPKSSHWLPWWLLFQKVIQHVLPDYIVIELMGTFWKNSACICLDTLWIHWLKKSQWNHNVSAE